MRRAAHVVGNLVSPALIAGYDYLKGVESPIAVNGEDAPSHGGAPRSGALNAIEKGVLVTGAVIAGLVIIPLGLVIYVFKRGSDLEKQHGEEHMTGEKLAALQAAGKKGGQAGLVLEGLAQAKERKTIRTPFGAVPNYGARLLPSAGELRILGEYDELAGLKR